MIGLVLAAGAGRRFGRPKALVEFDGARLVDRAVSLLRDGGCERVVVVSGAVALTVPGAEVVHNPQWATGMGSSLRAGLTAIGEADTVVVPVDMPWLGAEAVRRVAAAGTAGAAGSSLAVATYGGVRAHPVLLGAAHLAGVIASATGDAGARHYLRRHAHLVTEIPCDDTGSPRDVDRPGDLDPVGRT